MEFLFENQHFKLGYHPDLKTILMKWKEFETIDFFSYSFAFNKALEYGNSKIVENFISDIRKQGEIPANFRKWFQEDPLPRSVGVGLKRIAIVSESNILKRFFINHIMKESTNFGITIKMFYEMENAVVWIKSQQISRLYV